MAKVHSFDSVPLASNEAQVNNISERWMVQFAGGPGMEFVTKDGIKTLSNVHYVCPYRKHAHGWVIDPWKQKFLVKDFDFDCGVVIVDGIIKELEFHVDEKVYA